jgi:heat shock protein HslJ
MLKPALPRFVVPSLLALLLAGGCQTRSGDEAPGGVAVTPQAEPQTTPAGERLLVLPVETEWSLSTASAKGLDRPEASAITLRIAPKRLSGSSGCNSFSVGFHMAEDGALSVGQPAATKRGCPGAVGTVEQALFTLLPQLNAAWQDGDALVLSAADGSTLRFVPAVAAP